jgi:protease-4
MSELSERPGFIPDLARELRELRTVLTDQWISFAATLRNQFRTIRRVRLDYVIIPLSGHLPERDAPARSFIQRQLRLPAPPFSMQALNRQLRAVADASNVTGVVVVLQGLDLGLASAQNLRRAFQRLRECGKELILFSPYLDLTHYYVATAADRIIAPPGAQFNVLGLRSELLFFKDALARLGVEAEAIQISPYKTGPNAFSRSDITPEQQEQLDWLLDDWYDMITADMADGRSLDQDQLKKLIDGAPYFAKQAKELGLVDMVAYEDEIPFILAKSGSEDGSAEVKKSNGDLGDNSDNANEPKARLKSWSQASPMLTEIPRRRPTKFVGVISLEGAITMGPSRTPPIDLPIPLFGGATAGEQTLVQLLRQVEKIDDMAALIFHVDSGGGSSLASELIGRQIKRISQDKTVLIFMGDAAASGGYYVSAAAEHIMCQPATVTGSIGVWSIHLNTQDLYRSASINRIGLDRGERADLYSDAGPLTSEERRVFQDGVVKAYDQFKTIVSDGRGLPYEELDPVCEGRVWTGRQALEHRLVDSHGDFVDAVRKAAELAGLPCDDQHIIPVANFYPGEPRYAPPLPFPAGDALEQLQRLLSGETLQALEGQPLLMMPFEIRLK